jgi:hypothetical protein
MLKGMERPGIGLGMSIMVSHVRLERRSQRRSSGKKNVNLTSKTLSLTKLFSYYIPPK